jgi:outer membrane protein, multidrug efflux system
MRKKSAHSRLQTRPSPNSIIGAACLVAAFLSGCALAHPPQHSSMVTASLPPSTTIPPTWGANATSKEAVADDWLKSFSDPGLDAVVAEAIKNNLDLRQAAAKVEMSRQTVVIVGAQLKPQVGAVFAAAGTRDTSQSDAFFSQGAYLGASWEIDVWGRLRAQQAAARAGFEAVGLDYAFARQSLAATTAKSWYLTVETRRLVDLASQDVELYNELLKLAKIREAAGKVANLDVVEASASLNETEGQLRKMQSLYDEARRNLETLIGRYPGGEMEVDSVFVPVPPPVPAGLPGSLLERRPDLLAAERQVLATFRTLEASKLALLPSITLTADGGRLDDRLLSLLNLNPTLFHSALQIYVPIYQGSALRAQIRISEAQQEQALAAYGSAALNAFREVEIALNNEGLLAQRLAYEQSAGKDRDEAVRIGRLKYQAGVIDMLSLVQLQTSQVETAMEIVQTMNSQLANRINLHLDLGGSFDVSPAAAPPNTTAVTFRTP